MRSAWFLLSVLVLGIVWAPRAHSATVAVMPVQGVNLSEGECDAIGVLFATAFSRDANVVVASPLETKSIRHQVQTSLEAATQMGVALYAELTAMQLATNVRVQGTLFGKDGKEIYRAQTVAPSLGDMEIEIAKLARALIMRQPVPRTPRPVAAVDVPSAPEVPKAPPEPMNPNATRIALGVKAAFMLPVSSGRTFAPMASAQFNGRIGARVHFFEFGAGVARALSDTYSNGWNDIPISLLFLELGGSYYLSEGSSALYLGGGFSSGTWHSEVGHESSLSGTLAAYGQIGMTLNRDSRDRFYVEIRVSQYLLAVGDSVVDSAGYSTGGTSTYHPTLIALQFGIGR